MKTRKGFTLIEMIISIAIIMIITAAMSVSVSSYMQRTQRAADVVDEHDERYNSAREQVEKLKFVGNPGTPAADAPDVDTPAGGAPAGGTPADGTPADGTPADGTPAGGTPAGGTPAGGTPADGTPADGTPADGTPADGTPAGGTPEAPAPEAPAADTKVNVGGYSVPSAPTQPTWVEGAGFRAGQPSVGWGPYEYNVVFNFPRDKITTYAAIFLPEGAPAIKEWYNCKVLAYDPDLHIAVVSIPPYIGAPAIRVDYPGDQKNWKQTTIYYTSPTEPKA